MNISHFLVEHEGNTYMCQLVTTVDNQLVVALYDAGIYTGTLLTVYAKELTAIFESEDEIV